MLITGIVRIVMIYLHSQKPISIQTKISSMKKNLLFISALMLVATFSFAQFSGGLKGGATMSSMSGDKSTGWTYGSNFGFHVGAFGNYAFTDMISAQLELLYSTKGWKESSSSSSFSFKETITPKYLDIPILLQAKLSSGLFFQVGPEIGLLMSAHYKSTSTIAGNTHTSDTTDTKGWNKTDFAIGVGAGYQMESGLSFGLRANIGLANINDNSSTSTAATKPVDHNMWYQLSIGYAFGGGGSGHGHRRR